MIKFQLTLDQLTVDHRVRVPSREVIERDRLVARPNERLHHVGPDVTGPTHDYDQRHQEAPQGLDHNNQRIIWVPHPSRPDRTGLRTG